MIENWSIQKYSINCQSMLRVCCTVTAQPAALQRRCNNQDVYLGPGHALGERGEQGHQEPSGARGPDPQGEKGGCNDRGRTSMSECSVIIN